MEEGLLERNHEEVAKFLYSDGLNKTAIGDYLGEKYVQYINSWPYES